MNNLKFTDVSSILNDVFNLNEAPDDTTLGRVNDNLSNIADIGAKLTEGTDYDTLFKKTFPSMVDKVKETRFINRRYIGSAPYCITAPDTYRGIVEFVRTDVGEYDVNHLFDVIDRDDDFTGTIEHFNDLFGKELPSVTAKYYTMCKTYRQKITKTTDQFISAFTSPDAMMSFFASIESALAVKYDFAVDMLQYLTFDSAVVEKISLSYSDTAEDTENEMIANGSLVKSTVHLNNGGYSIENCTTIINELKSVVRRYKRFSKYGGADFMNSYSADDIHIAIDAKLYDAIITNKAFVMNDEYFEIPLSNIHPVISFMPYDISDASNRTIGGKSHSGVKFSIDNVLYVVYTTQSFACTVIDKKITSQYVADEDYTNVFHNSTMTNVINTDFPLTIGTTASGSITVTE